MARIARVIAPGAAHIVQRGNRRQNVFLKEGDQKSCLSIVKEQAGKYHRKERR
jgi:REP element-mobilizing transposase RayT